MMVNYGIENLRFANPVKVNDEIRMHATLANISDLRGTIKTEMKVKIEIKGEKKPALAAQLIFLYHFQ